MKTFKTFFEDEKQSMLPVALKDVDTLSILPDTQSLEDYMAGLEGETVKNILDQGSYVNLYMGNEYNISGTRDINYDTADFVDGRNKALQDFSEALGVFVNRDDEGRGPHPGGDHERGFRPRVYETDEFKKANNYEQHAELEHQHRLAAMSKIKARQAGDDEAMAAASEKADDFQRQMKMSQWAGARKKAWDEEEKLVWDLRNTPLTKDKLSPDGSAEYESLRQAFNRVQQYKRT
jgi:hypothetical protein